MSYFFQEFSIFCERAFKKIFNISFEFSSDSSVHRPITAGTHPILLIGMRGKEREGRKRRKMRSDEKRVSGGSKGGGGEMKRRKMRGKRRRRGRVRGRVRE